MKKIVIAHVVNWTEIGYQLFSIEKDSYGDEQYYHFHDCTCRTYDECIRLCKKYRYNLIDTRPVEF